MARFFLAGSAFDDIELKELLLRRYHGLDFIKDLTLPEFIEFIFYAQKQDREERMYEHWCAMLPQMAEYKPFEEFRDILTGANIDRRSNEEILADVAQIEKEQEERQKNGI